MGNDVPDSTARTAAADGSAVDVGSGAATAADGWSAGRDRGAALSNSDAAPDHDSIGCGNATGTAGSARGSSGIASIASVIAVQTAWRTPGARVRATARI